MDFADAVNSVMKDLARRAPVRQDELHPLTADLLGKMLESEVGLTPELLEAMPHVFRIFGGEREEFIAAGKQAVSDERVRRNAVWLASPDGQATILEKQIANEATTQTEAALQLAGERVTNNQQAWRENNPEGMSQSPSFQEMLETSHAKGEDFKQFLFERVITLPI